MTTNEIRKPEPETVTIYMRNRRIMGTSRLSVEQMLSGKIEKLEGEAMFLHEFVNNEGMMVGDAVFLRGGTPTEIKPEACKTLTFTGTGTMRDVDYFGEKCAYVVFLRYDSPDSDPGEVVATSWPHGYPTRHMATSYGERARDTWVKSGISKEGDLTVEIRESVREPGRWHWQLRDRNEKGPF